jgi:uncharacterized spore protein YtfJ
MSEPVAVMDEAVMNEAREAAQGGVAGFLDRLANRVGLHARASAVFGEPVERGELTVIPVAKVRAGFGGGTGSMPATGGEGDTLGEGGGGGGGFIASPLGFIEMRESGATFRRIEDPVAYWPLALAGGVATWLVLRGLRGLLKR